MSLQRTLIPRAIIIITTVVLVIYYLFARPVEMKAVEDLPRWGSIITAWVIVGATSIYMLRLGIEIKERRVKAWYLNFVQIGFFVLFLAVGFILGEASVPYKWMNDYLIGPISTMVGTVICSMAFFPSSHRLMRIRGADSLALMAGFLLVLLRYTPVLQAIATPLTDAIIWLEDYPITASRGAAFIGVSLAGVAIIIRTMAGLTRGVT